MSKAKRGKAVRSASDRLRRLGKRAALAPGAPPGAFHVAPDAGGSALGATLYGPQAIEEVVDATLSDIQRLRSHEGILWVNVDGLGDAHVLGGLAAAFGVHPLALEDIVHTHQRPKVERYGDQLFVVARMMTPGGRDLEQVAFVLAGRTLLTFQEKAGDCFEPVRLRLRDGRKSLREGGADYLLYALLDAIVDHYFPALDDLGERLLALEDAVLESAGREQVQQIRELKLELMTLRRAAWPLRDAVMDLTRESTAIIAADTQLFLRDCADHATHVRELIETYREFASDLLGLWTSQVSNEMNEGMRLLTVIATIFIPLTFIAGLYGMNFDTQYPWNMPELRSPYGYPMALALMFGVFVALLVFFRRLGWIGRRVLHPPASGEVH